tara:strand:+ start:1853 stop:2779 length:927 start_codon:yes stop_codon:yes gene_type:complete
MKKVFLATSTFGKFSKKPLELLEERKISYFCNTSGKKLSNNDLVKKLKECDGVIAGTELYSSKVLEQLPKLKVISRLGIGLDNVDLEFAKKKEIKIFKTQTSLNESVSELTLGLMINVAKKINQHSYNLKSGIWKKEMGILLSNKTLGIIGLGGIGKSLVKLCQGFNFNILAYDINKDNNFAKKYKIKYESFQNLLKKSDILSFHTNLNKSAINLMGKTQFDLLKKNVIILNTSRGGVFKEKDLLDFLKKNKNASAGIDVFNEEPYKGNLLKLKNIITTPHIGSYSKEIRNKLEIESVLNLIKGLNND